jgi:superfamily I DNA/RNA helicase
MQITSEQKQAIQATGFPIAVIAGPGTGKTTTLVEKAAYLLESGKYAPGEIFIVVFNLQSHFLLMEKLKKRLGERANGIVCGTIRDFAWQALQASGDEREVADYTLVRRTLRKAMQAEGFTGTVQEAEQIIYKFKGLPRRPSANDPYVDLLTTYREMLKNENKVDRHDVVREHIMTMRNKGSKPCPAKYLLVNNLQDATHIQYIWLVDHMNAGAELCTFGNDEQAVFGPFGGLGSKVYDLIEEMKEIRQFDLKTNFRTPQNIAAAAIGAIKDCRSEITEDSVSSTPAVGMLAVEKFKTVDAELRWLVEQVPNWLKQYDNMAFVVHHDAQVHYLERALQEARIQHSCLAESVWQTPGALVVMDLLSIMIGQGIDPQLRNVLYSYGFKGDLIEAIFAAGIRPQTWLETGEAPGPEVLKASAGDVAAYREFYNKLHECHLAVQGKQVSAREGFRAMVDVMLERLVAEDREAALLATEGLLSIGGNLPDVIKALRKRRAPDPHARVVVGTVQGVRNLEFDHVVVPFMAGPIWPWRGFKSSGMDESNDRRMLYVAMTRSKQAVTLTHSGTASPFIKEVVGAFPGTATGSGVADNS